MRGFRERADVEEVEALLASQSAALPADSVAVGECAGRVLADPVSADIDVPHFARSSMDGFAVRGEDTFGASAYDPIDLEVIGLSLAGHGFKGCLERGQAVRIMTGAPMPQGADAVVMAEVCDEQAGRVAVAEAVAPKKNVGRRGEDIRAGEPLFEPGRVLRPQDAGLLASVGVAEVPCVRRPRIALVITGDELLPPGTRPVGDKIVDSNSVTLSALARRDVGEVLPYGILPDRPEEIRKALKHPEADVVLVSGGSSVGQEDHAPRLLAELGRLEVHGVAMRPSSPAGFGRIDERFVFLLPGNPVSCLCAYEFFAGPTIRALGGRSRDWPHPRVRLPLARKLSSAVGRTDYARVAIVAGAVVPLATSGASILSSTVRANGCVIIPRELEGMPEGEEVEVLLYDDASGGAR
jgi:molybdopterin molybdotransferase